MGITRFISNMLTYGTARAQQRLHVDNLSLRIGDHRCVVPNPPGGIRRLCRTEGLDKFRSDPSLVAAMAVLPGSSVFWDVGANIGLFALVARSVCKETEIVSIEPCGESYRYLFQNWCEQPARWTCLNIALGSRIALGSFSVGLGGMNHLIAETAPASALQRAPILTAEWLFASLGHERIDVMKIDVEGMEYDVLQGSAQLLASKKIGTLILESDGHGVRYGVSNRTVCDYLYGHGYSMDPRLTVQDRAGGNCLVFHATS